VTPLQLTIADRPSFVQYKVTLPNSQTGLTGTLYVAYVYTKFLGFFIGETIMAGSTELIDAYANLLHGISFRQDEINSECVMSSTPQSSKCRDFYPRQERTR